VVTAEAAQWRRSIQYCVQRQPGGRRLHRVHR
jgi:hypothetical protein